MKRIIALFLLICLCLTGCAKPENNTEPSKPAEEKKVRIGMSFDTFVVERWQRDRDIFVSAAKELGAEVNVQNSNGDVKEQIAQLEYFIEKKMDVIVVVPIAAESLKDVVKSAHAAGIKVICYDRLAMNTNADLYISFDNAKVGELMARGLKQALAPESKVAMICGSATDSNVAEVRNGFVSELADKDITVIDTVYADNWRPEAAFEYVNDNFPVIKDIQAIMCGNDSLAGQAIKALAENRMAGKIYVVGQDADLDACQRIVEGTQYMTVYKPVEKLAQQAAGAAVKLALGEELGVAETISDGIYNIPYIKLEPIGVTMENLDEIIIESGFHLKEDVYRNRPDLIVK